MMAAALPELILKALESTRHGLNQRLLPPGDPKKGPYPKGCCPPVRDALLSRGLLQKNKGVSE